MVEARWLDGTGFGSGFPPMREVGVSLIGWSHTMSLPVRV